MATNIAEASLTIDGIYYVVDPGFAKQKVGGWVCLHVSCLLPSRHQCTYKHPIYLAERMCVIEGACLLDAAALCVCVCVWPGGGVDW